MRLQAWLAPGVVFGLALAVYGLTAPAGLTWAHASADGGDLVTAARVLGVPHPSGYPTWTLLAILFDQLPLGTAAWRATLLSMVSGATACRAGGCHCALPGAARWRLGRRKPH